MQQAFASGKGADHDFALAVSLAWQATLVPATPWHGVVPISQKGAFSGALA